MARVFSSYHEDTGFILNQLPRVQMPYIPQNLAEDHNVKKLTMPHERGTFFTKKKLPRRVVIK